MRPSVVRESKRTIAEVNAPVLDGTMLPLPASGACFRQEPEVDEGNNHDN